MNVASTIRYAYKRSRGYREQEEHNNMNNEQLDLDETYTVPVSYVSI
jgi:hypothetical protein